MGLLLADGFLEKRKASHNTRLRVDHTYPTQEAYVKHLYEIFNPMCGKQPVISIRKPDKTTGKIYSSIAFKTYNLRSLNEYYTLFYKNTGDFHLSGQPRYKKIVASNIQDLLTPIGIAHWVMGDGYFTKDKTVVLCTESFSKHEIELLVNALQTKFAIAAGVLKRVSSSEKSGLRIRISKKSMQRFIALITPFFIPEFYYKLGITNF